MSETILVRDDLATSIRLRWDLTDVVRRGPGELSTAECHALIDEFGRVGVSYIDIGGGEPTIREDFWQLLDHVTGHHMSVGFATSGIRITPAAAAAIATSGRVDVRISLDGPTEAAADAIGGPGSFRTAVRAMELLASSGVFDFDLSVVITRLNVGRLDAFLAIADLFGARLRLSLRRSSGHTVEWLLPEQRRDLHRWLRVHSERVRAGDGIRPSFGGGESLLGSAVGVACSIDAVGDVHVPQRPGGAELRVGNIRTPGGFARIWRSTADHAREEMRHVDDLRACS